MSFGPKHPLLNYRNIQLYSNPMTIRHGSWTPEPESTQRRRGVQSSPPVN